MEKPHHIKTLKFELDIPNASKNKSVQNRIVNVFNSQFSAMLNEVLSSYDENEDLIIEALTLELEPVPIDNLETHITSQSRTQLLNYFDKYKAEKKTKMHTSNLERTSDDYSLHPLLYYLNHGIDSWHSSSSYNFKDQWVIALNEIGFRTQFKGVNWNENAIQRLVNQMDHKLYQNTIQKIFSINSDAILKSFNLLLDLFLENKQLKKVVAKDRDSTLWKLSLIHLLTSKRNSFDNAHFISHVLQKVATHFNIELEDLKSDVLLIIKGSSKFVHDSDFEQISLEFKEAKNIQKDSNSKSEYNITTKQIEKWLLDDKLSEYKLSIIKDWILQSTNRLYLQQNWIEPLKNPILEASLKAVSPEGFEFVIEYHKTIFNHAKTSNLTTSHEALKRAVWTFTFDYFTTSFSSIFQAKTFVRFHAKKLSNRYALDASLLIKSLISSIYLLLDISKSQNNLLGILKVLSSEHAENIDATHIEKSSEANLTIEKLIPILETKKRLSYQQINYLRRWIQNRKNMVIIKKNYIGAHRLNIIHHIIETILPSESEFIFKSMKTIYELFDDSDIIKNERNFSKSLYRNFFNYLPLQIEKFNRKAYLQFQVAAILKNFDISYKKLLELYSKHINNTEKSNLSTIEFLKLFNELQRNFEKEFDIRKDLTNHKLSLYELGNLFKNGVDNDYHNTISKNYKLKNNSINALQSTFESLLLQKSKKWFYYLENQSKPFQLHASLKPQVRTSLLRTLHEFNEHYRKWKFIKKRLNNSLNENQITMIFFLEESIMPLWSLTGHQNDELKKPILDSFKSISHDYKWSNKAMENWVNLVPQKRKYEFLKEFVNVHEEHELFRIYKLLKPIFDSLANVMLPSSYFSFETSFWMIFFDLLSEKTPEFSSAYMMTFFKKWEEQCKVPISSNIKVKKLLYRKSNLQERDNSLNDRNQVLESFNDENIPLSLDIEYEVMNEELTKWHIFNCGLVLVHPFLVQLFKSLEYLNNENKFKNEEVQFRAISLLYFVATGKINPENESFLAMPKILCGIDIQKAIPQTILLEEEEKEMALEMVQALIKNWKVMKNTSADGLRNTFFIRTGMLEIEEKAYQLTMESSGTDILLDSIPWNVNLIKLPWMDKIIYVSWR